LRVKPQAKGSLKMFLNAVLASLKLASLVFRLLNRRAMFMFIHRAERVSGCLVVQTMGSLKENKRIVGWA